MNTTRYFRSETVKVLRNRKGVLRAAALAFAIAVASVPASARDQSGLEGLLNAIAAGAKVSPRVSLPLQVGFVNGQPALYITPKVGVAPSGGRPSSLPRNRSPLGSTPISFLRTSLHSLVLRQWMTSSCSAISLEETC